ncbi:MAG: adenylate/guanylate cyclase domain-containing protein [Bacteroidia bacterium]
MKQIFSVVFILMLGSLNAQAGDTARINLLLEKSKEVQRTDQDASLRFATEAYALSKENNFPFGVAGAQIRIGSILYANGKVDSARILIQQALAFYASSESAKGAGAACLLLSYLYLDLGMKDSAFAAVYAAMRWNQQTNDSFSLAQNYIHLGNLHLDYGDPDQAFQNYSLAAGISARNKYKENLISAWDGLGQFYLETNDFRQSLVYFLKVDSAAKRAEDNYTIAQNLTNIALCHEELNDLYAAKTYYYQALQACLKLNMLGDVALGYYNVGSIYLEQYNMDSSKAFLDSAIFNLDNAVVYARLSDDIVRIARSYMLLAEAHAKKNNFIQAYAYQLSYSKLSDSIISNEKVKQIAEMQTRYETEKKEQQIVLLDAQNKTKSAQRNILILSSVLLLLLAIAIFIGLMRTKKQRQISESLLLNILPREVANELKQKGSAEAQFFDEVTVMFTDIVDFTGITEKHSPQELVELLHACFKAFDAIIGKYKLEKIKTIGDSYLCAGGLPIANTTHAREIVKAGLEIQEFMKEHKNQRLKEGKIPIEMRLGIHTGPVVAGIVGVKKFAYDIWGETVNTASRMEHSGEAGKVNVSAATYARIKDHFICTSRGQVEIKHKKLIEMYFVEGSMAEN